MNETQMRLVRAMRDWPEWAGPMTRQALGDKLGLGVGAIDHAVGYLRKQGYWIETLKGKRGEGMVFHGKRGEL